MIFKQLPTAISDLNKLGIALKSLDAMKLGTVGVNLGNVEAYRTALKGLSVEQSVFALASKGATEEQIRQILVTDQAKLKDVEAAMAKAGLTTATKALNAEELIALATKKGISAERAKEIASALGLIATEEGQIISKKQLTVATLQQAGATDAEITAMLGLNAVETTNIGITNVLTASFTKLWAVITAHPIGAIITAIGAVAVGTIAYINKVNKDAEKALVEAHENAEKSLEDTKTSLSDDKSELQSVNSELETTKEKIKEISSIGAPTLTKQNELNKLSTANAQLEAQKTLLENNIKLKQKSAALDAKELLGTQVEMEYSSILDNSSITSKKESYTYADHAKYQASNLKNAYNIYMKALEEGNVKRQELAQELIDASAGDTAELTSELLEIVESFKYDDGTIIDGYEDIYNEYMGMIYNLQSLTNPDTFLEIAKSVTTGKSIDYEKAVSEAYVLAYEGNFDIDKLNQDFVKALADAGIDDTTIEYIFKLKQQEYQSVVDSINQKYNPEKVLAPTYLEAPGHVDTPEQTQQKELDRQNYEKQKEEIQAINDSLTEYARKNPIEFQLITSYDENFSTLDKYIEEEKSKVQSVKEELGSLSQNGNVDLTIRPVIDSSAMKAAGWDVEDGSIATTFTQGEFVWQGGEDDGQYVYVHYTPILPDGTVLTPDQLSNYLYGTLESSKNILEADDKGIVLKVDTDLQGVSAEDIKQLQENGIQTDGMQSFLNSMGQWDDSVHTVQESYYDMSGTVDYVDNAIKRLVEDAKKTEGIDTDETDISISDVFSFKNAENEATILSELNDKLSEVKSAYETCLSAKEEYDEQGYLSVDTLQKVISLGDDYLQYLFDEQGNVKLDAEAFKQLTLARINDMEAQALQNLAENIKQITDEATATEYLAQKQNELASSYTDVAINALLAMQQIKGFSNSEALQGAYNSFKTQYEQIKSLFAHTRSGLGKEFNGISDSAKKATKDAEQATKEYIDSYMNYMEKSLESGRIDYQTYSRDVAKFLKDMYDQGKIAAKDYHDYTKQMLEVQKDAMDSVISAVTNRLDKEIDFYEDQIDAVEERYQTEIDYLDTVIEYYENQKKALQDTNDELDRQKALEEALYNLYQKQTQKTIGLYTADKGKIYTTDASAIRDAEDNVRKAKLDIEIAKLDEAIEKVEQQQDALRDAMDKEKEQLQEIIDRLEEYKEQWQNVAKEYEIAQNEMMASQILGADWESQILSGRIDTLNTFAQNYIAIQQAIADAAWASANAQIEAAKEAQKGANGNTSGAGSVGSVGDKTEVSTRYKVVDESGKTLISYSGNNAQSKAESYKDRLDDAVHDLDKVKVVKYATGTKHAKKGLNLVGEDGTETFIDNDGNVSLVTKPSLIPMEGGEIVKNEKETKSLLDSMNLVPVQTGDIWKKFAGNMPDLSSMIKVNTPDYSKISGMVSKAQTIEQHNQFNVTLPNITDSTKATKLFEELQRLPLDALQYANTRKK